MPPNSSALRITAGNNGAISVQQSQLQPTHQVGDNNSEASTSPLNASTVGSDGGGNNGISNNLGSQHYLTVGQTTDNTNEMMTTLNEPPSASAMQQLNTQVIPTGSIIIKTEDNDDSPIGEFLIPDSSTQSISPSTTITSGHHFIHESSPTDHLSPPNHQQHHLSGSTLILGPTHSQFELHQQQPNHHEPSPPEIGSTTMWEDIASSIKKLDPDHADVLLVASCASSSGNVLVPTYTSMAQHSQQNHFSTIGGDHPQMIVTSVQAQGDSHLMQDHQQQDCNSYVITSLPNDNNGAPICLLPSNQSVNHSAHVGGTTLLSGGEISDNNSNITVSSMAPSNTTNAFPSMSFDSSSAVSNGIHSFDYDPGQRDSKEGILNMDSVNLSPDSDPRSHISLQQQDGRHCHQQQHDINQNPSNPSAITVSSPVSSQLSYQQINPILDNQSSHSHHQQQHHPPHSNQHHVQLQPSNANLSNHRY